jgi:hypothetical protein
MGPQIPLTTSVEDSELRVEQTIVADPLEFASSHLMIYGISMSEGFKAIQSLSLDIASRLESSVR